MNTDWRAMFVKYVEIVGEQQGVRFLSDEDWLPEEWEAIAELVDPVLVPKGWNPL